MEPFVVAENRIFDVDGHQFLFLVRENAIFEMDADTKAIVERWPHSSELSMQDFLSYMEGSNEGNSALFDGLVRRRIVVSKNAFPEGPQSAGTSIPISTLVLNVTDECNLACLYCYRERGDDGKGASRIMTPEVARRAVDFLLEHSGILNRVTLVFFGGEPFLNFRLISLVTEYARARASEKGKRIDFAVTTNGTLLTDEVIRFICENEMSVTVSIDGYESVHDRFRRFRNGTPSYEAIVGNVKRLLEAPLRRPVVARVTVAENPEEACAIIDHLLSLGFSEVGLAPVTTRDSSCRLDEEGMSRLLEQFRLLSERFLATAEEGGLLGFSNLIDLLVVLHEGEIKKYPCGAGFDLFSVAPDGRLNLCQRLTEDDSCMGDIFGGINEAKIDEFRSGAEVGRKEPCGNCWARVTCAGGCYHEALLREGSLTTPNLHYCEWIRKWVEIGMEIYCRISLKCPEYLDKLSALRGHGDVLGRNHEMKGE